MQNIIILGLVLIILVLAVGYVWRSKKYNQGCVGCPYAKKCGSKDCVEEDDEVDDEIDDEIDDEE